jgi:hypothetical protein
MENNMKAKIDKIEEELYKTFCELEKIYRTSGNVQNWISARDKLDTATLFVLNLKHKKFTKQYEKENGKYENPKENTQCLKFFKEESKKSGVAVDTLIRQANNAYKNIGEW